MGGLGKRRAGERGQVLPVWIAAFLTCLGLMFMVLNYGNQIRWQIRAQNAADSAAAAAISIQSERWNLISELLYGLNVEDYRARRLLDGLLFSMNQSGGCVYNSANLSDTTFGKCAYVYAKLRDPFMRSANRYAATANMLQVVASKQTFANWESDVATLLTYFKTNCNNANQSFATYNAGGGDCGFYYSEAPSGIAGRTGIEAVSQDAENILIPSLGKVSATIPNDSEASEFDPGEVDIVTCAVIPPIVPKFGPFSFQTVYAVGRAAATNVLLEEDWLQPGRVIDPVHSTSIADDEYFQPVEDYVDNITNGDFAAGCTAAIPNETTCLQSTTTIPWYNVDYGGNTTSASAAGNGFSSPLTTYEMSARVGWWGPIPIKPFGGSPTLNATTCHP